MRGAASKSDASDLGVVDLRKPIEDPATRAALVKLQYLGVGDGLLLQQMQIPRKRPQTSSAKASRATIPSFGFAKWDIAPSDCRSRPAITA